LRKLTHLDWNTSTGIPTTETGIYLHTNWDSFHTNWYIVTDTGIFYFLTISTP